MSCKKGVEAHARYVIVGTGGGRRDEITLPVRGCARIFIPCTRIPFLIHVAAASTARDRSPFAIKTLAAAARV